MQRRLVFALLLMTLVSRASSLDTQVEAARRVVGLARDIQSPHSNARSHHAVKRSTEDDGDGSGSIAVDYPESGDWSDDEDA